MTTPATLAAPFAFTTFGAVEEIKVVTRKTVHIPADRRADFKAAAAWFATQTNTTRLNLDAPQIATEADAVTLRAQLTTYAEEFGLTLNLDKHIAAHTVTRTETADGTVTITREPDNAPAIDKRTVTRDDVNSAGTKTKVTRVPDNGVPAHWNVGTNVNFRIVKPTVKESKNGPVTVTQTAPTK